MSAILKVFPNKLDRELFEENTIDSNITFLDYLAEHVPNYDADKGLLFSLTANGKPLLAEEWGSYVIQFGDVLEATVEAKDPWTIAAVIISVIAIGSSIYAMNQIPDNYNQTTPDGSSIYRVNTQGNQAKLMGIRPELSGRHKIYPDWLNKPRYEFIDNEEWVYLFYGVTNGYCEIKDNEIYIGDTPINRYTGDYVLTIFEPGEDVTTHDAHRNIYTSSEVSNIELEGSLSTSIENGLLKWSFQGTTLTCYRLIYRAEHNSSFPQIINFPYQAGEIVLIDSVGEPNDGAFKVVSVDGRIATMQKVDIDGNSDNTWETFTEQIQVVADVESQNGSGSHYGPYFACPEKETTDKIYIDFELPQGLGELDDNGEFIEITVAVEIQYRDENTITWNTVSHSFTNGTNDQLAETLEVLLPAKMRPEVRVKRVTSAKDDTRTYDLVKWSKLKSELESASSYEGMTTIALKIKGSNSLSKSAENKFNVIATRKLPVWDDELGQWGAMQPTQDIIPFFSYVIKDVGHGDEHLDFDTMTALNNTWQSRGDLFNALFDSGSTLFEVLKRVLAVGYAEPTLDYGQIIPVRDEPREVFEHMYQPQNMLKGGLTHSIKLIDEDEPDGVEIEYFSAQTWKSETMLCLLPGDLGVKPEKVRAFGITDKDKAWRLGMYKRRMRRYRRIQYSFKTEMDALNSRYLSYCALADDIPGYSQTGKVEAAEGNVLYLDQPLEWQTGTHYLAIRKPDGTLSGLYTAAVGSDAYQVILDRPLDFTPVLDGIQESPLFMFGVAERWSLPALITDISPSGTDKVSVKGVNYDERVYADYDNNAPE